MSLKDNIWTDIHGVFMNQDEFAESHVWNGVSIVCVVDKDSDLKRKSNITHDVQFGTGHATMNVYIPDDQLERRPDVNTEVLLDGTAWRVLIVDEEMGIWIVTLAQSSAQYY